MTKEEFARISNEVSVDPIISPSELSNPEKDRTLLYGYTCDRATWHVYLKGGKIYTVMYSYNECPVLMPEGTYVPDKRIYPARSDYEFCSLLKERGYYLPFTTYEEKEVQLNPNGFYGETYE